MSIENPVLLHFPLKLSALSESNKRQIRVSDQTYHIENFFIIFGDTMLFLLCKNLNHWSVEGRTYPFAIKSFAICFPFYYEKRENQL